MEGGRDASGTSGHRQRALGMSNTLDLRPVSVSLVQSPGIPLHTLRIPGFDWELLFQALPGRAPSTHHRIRTRGILGLAEAPFSTGKAGSGMSHPFSFPVWFFVFFFLKMDIFHCQETLPKKNTRHPPARCCLPRSSIPWTTYSIMGYPYQSQLHN